MIPRSSQPILLLVEDSDEDYETALRTFKKYGARLSEQLVDLSIIDESDALGKVLIDIGAVGDYVGPGKNREFLFDGLRLR